MLAFRVAKVAQSVVQGSRISTQFLRPLCTAQGPLLDEDKDLFDVEEGLRAQESGVEQVKPGSKLSKGNEAETTTYTVEQQRFKREKEIRKKHFESDISKRVLAIADYNGKSDLDFEDKWEYEEFMEQQRSDASRAMEAPKSKGRNAWDDNDFRGQRGTRRFEREQEDWDSGDDEWLPQKSQKSQRFGLQERRPQDKRDMVFGNKINSREPWRRELEEEDSEDDEGLSQKPQVPLTQRLGQRRPQGNREWSPSNIFGMSKAGDSSGYNFGLPGLGKKSPQTSDREKASFDLPKLQGEVLHGLHPCLMALQQGRRKCHQLFIKADMLESKRPMVQLMLAKAEAQGVEVHMCQEAMLSQLSKTRPHQGVCLDADKLKPIPLTDETANTSEKSTAHKHRLWLIVDKIQDPMNLGAMLRSSHYLGVDRVITLKDNSCPLSPVVSKASAGALEVMDLYSVEDLSSFLKSWKEKGWRVMGTKGASPVSQDSATADTDSLTPPYTADSTPPAPVEQSASPHILPLSDISVDGDTILIMGNEGSGLGSDIEAMCDQLITVPPGRSLHPHMDSLNVSVATGVILHHLMYTKQQT